MKNKLKERTPEEKHRNSLLRIAKSLDIVALGLNQWSCWELEDAILERIDQRKLNKKNILKQVKKLQKEIDMLRQTSIFDFLKIHYDEIQSQETHDFMVDDGQY